DLRVEGGLVLLLELELVGARQAPAPDADCVVPQRGFDVGLGDPAGDLAALTRPRLLQERVLDLLRLGRIAGAAQRRCGEAAVTHAAAAASPGRDVAVRGVGRPAAERERERVGGAALGRMGAVV